MNRLRVGVIGLGIGEQHAPAFQSIPECELAILCDSSSDALERVGRKFPRAELIESADAVLARSDIHIVSIASYDDSHAEYVIKALENGKHVFVEKPLCRTFDELKNIKAAWLSAGKKRKLGSNLVLRGAPLYEWLKRQVLDKKLGQIYAFDGDYLYGRMRKITEGWRKDIKNYSVIEGGGIHLIDLMLWVLGDRPYSAMAVGNRICTRNTAFKYNDYVAAQFRFRSGLVGRVTANFGCVHRHHHVVRLFGTEATFIYDDAGARWHQARGSAVAVERCDCLFHLEQGRLRGVFERGLLRDEPAATR